MPLQDHVESLRAKHAHLEELIDQEMHRPLPDQARLSRLKKEKLRIKEQIERLARQTSTLDAVPQSNIA